MAGVLANISHQYLVLCLQFLLVFMFEITVINYAWIYSKYTVGKKLSIFYWDSSLILSDDGNYTLGASAVHISVISRKTGVISREPKSIP